ncbi:putative endonuclease/Exonuclease/phosphatase family [Trypoxylus dichotomus]
MPPKRKAATTKAAAAAAEVIENGAEPTEPPKAKRGKATKAVEKPENAEEVKKTTRTTRAKAAAPVVEEKQVTEEENKKEKKGKGKVAEGKVTEPVVEKKATAAKKKETKPKKEAAAEKKKAPAAKPKSDAKAKSTRGAKKGNDETEKPTSTKSKTTKKKQPSNSESEEEPPKKTRTDAKTDNSLQNQIDTDFSTIDFTCGKENSIGNLPNLKISSWNVDGVRAWLKKKGLQYVEHEKPDIFCLQETKCSEDKIPDELNKFMDYKAYWCSSEKDGYAGVAVFSKSDPISVEYGIGNEEFDEEGRCITAEYQEFYLVNVYVPNAGRKLVTLPKRLEWNTIFKDYVAKLDERKPVIVCGDMNVAHNEIDLANPKTNKRNAGFTQEERDGFTDFLEEKYVDTYRNFYPDQKNAYTFWTYMMKARSKDIGWRLDYFIVSKRFLDRICDNVIRTNVYGSDHCPITLFLNV